MANADPTPFEEKISTISKLLKLAESELRNVPKLVEVSPPKPPALTPQADEGEQEKRLAELAGQIARECSDMFSYGNRRGASIFTSKVVDAILEAADEHGLIDLEKETYLNYRRASKLSKLKRSYVLERDSHRCVRCGDIENLTIDHIHPVIRGGTDDLHNLQVLCHSCNASKHHKVVK